VTSTLFFRIWSSKAASVCSTGVSWAAFVDKEASDQAAIATTDSTKPLLERSQLKSRESTVCS
jgi:hypothetical protein